MKIDILTLFPEMFVPVTDSSILGKAREKGILDINLINIRDLVRISIIRLTILPLAEVREWLCWLSLFSARWNLSKPKVKKSFICLRGEKL